MKRRAWLVPVLAALLPGPVIAGFGAEKPVASGEFEGFVFPQVGPCRGVRVTAAMGVASQPDAYQFGALPGTVICHRNS